LSGLTHILLTSGVLSAAILAGWVALSARLKRAGSGKWRAAAVCLPLLMASAAYGLYWLAFFSSPAAAVQTRAIWLTLKHVAGPYAGFGWTAFAGIALWLLHPLSREG
jgi:hypothetical protein